jgi:hypothetical protein
MPMNMALTTYDRIARKPRAMKKPAYILSLAPSVDGSLLYKDGSMRDSSCCKNMICTFSVA